MRASRRTAASDIVPLAILRDADLRSAPQDEVRGFDFDRAKLLVSQNRSTSLVPACEAPLFSAPFSSPTDGVAFSVDF
jgi:hypothetical protein